jgi:hypothetical protein
VVHSGSTPHYHLPLPQHGGRNSRKVPKNRTVCCSPSGVITIEECPNRSLSQGYALVALAPDCVRSSQPKVTSEPGRPAPPVGSYKSSILKADCRPKPRHLQRARGAEANASCLSPVGNSHSESESSSVIGRTPIDSMVRLLIH